MYITERIENLLNRATQDFDGRDEMLREAVQEIKKLRQFLFPYADRTDISGISWDGKYLIGDKESISVFREMQNRGLQIDVYRRAYEERVAVLKQALQPFAACADEIEYTDKEKEESTSDEEWAKFRLLVGDYRRAKKALD